MITGEKKKSKKKRRRSRVIKRKKKEDKQDNFVSSNIIKTVKELKKKKTVDLKNRVTEASRKTSNENSEKTFSTRPKFKTLKSTGQPGQPDYRKGLTKSRSDLESTRENRDFALKKNMIKKPKKRTADKEGGSKKAKRFKIGAPSNYERMKSMRKKMKKERDKPKIYESPDPNFAFETMYKRSKRLKEFFMDQGSDENFSLNFCRTNWHFKATFESFLVEMVKMGEITKEFNQLNRKTADKIEGFIREKVEANLEFRRNEEILKKGFREFNKELRKYKAATSKRSEALKGFFDNYQPEILV